MPGFPQPFLFTCELINQIERKLKLAKCAVMLNKMRRAAYPALIFQKRENAPDFALKPLKVAKAQRGLNTYAAHNRKAVAVFVKPQLI